MPTVAMSTAIQLYNSIIIRVFGCSLIKSQTMEVEEKIKAAVNLI